VRTGKLSAGKAKVLVGLTVRNQRAIATKAIENRFNTRQVEGAVRDIKSELVRIQPSANKPEKDSNTRQLEVTLSEQLGSPVAINWDAARNSGELSIKYFSLDELQAIIDRLQGARGQTQRPY
jgi:ParB family chromosome partitioning protein